MAATREFPKRQRMPGIDEDSLPRQAKERKEMEQQHHSRHLEGDHRRPHGGQRVADAGGAEEDELGDRRIDRRRVDAAIDVGENCVVPQRREVRIDRDVAIGIDPGGLDPTVPDIAVRVIREIRRSKQDRETHQRRDHKHRCERTPGESAPPRQRDREEIDRALREREDDEAVMGVPALKQKPDAGQDQHSGAERRQDPGSPAGAHGAICSAAIPSTPRRSPPPDATSPHK